MPKGNLAPPTRPCLFSGSLPHSTPLGLNLTPGGWCAKGQITDFLNLIPRLGGDRHSLSIMTGTGLARGSQGDGTAHQGATREGMAPLGHP